MMPPCASAAVSRSGSRTQQSRPGAPSRAPRQTEGLIGSIMHLLGLELAVPDHSTLSRRAETLELPRPRTGSAPVHLLVDSTGLKLCGAGEWLLDKHGTKTRRSWKKLV